MSHIEGDGVIEDIYYLLWRKDSPWNEKLQLKIPETVVFRRGRPIAWYFTNSNGVVLRKKPTSLTYPDILQKFSKGASEGDIVAYFINIDEEKKLARLLDKSLLNQQSESIRKVNNIPFLVNLQLDDRDEEPSHKVEYFSYKEFSNISLIAYNPYRFFIVAHTFSDYKNFENKTGILQKFIHPYGSNNGNLSPLHQQFRITEHN